MQRLAAAGVAAIAVAWGTIGLFVRWTDLPAVAFVFARCALAALTLGLVLGLGALWSRGAHPAARRPPRRWPVAALGVLLAGHWLCLAAAQQRAPLGTVLLITYLAPVIVTVLAPRLLGEEVPRTTGWAAVLGLAGVAILVRPGVGFGAGEALALAAAVSYAGLTLGSKAIVRGVGGIRLAFGELAVAAVVLAPFVLASDRGSPEVDWWWLVLVGVVLTGGLVAAYLTLLDRLPAATVSVLTYLEVVSAVVVGWVFLDEVPTFAMVAGGALVIAAGIMVVPRAAQRSAAPERSEPRGAPR